MLSSDSSHVRQSISQQEVRYPRRLCIDDSGTPYVTQGKYGGKQVWVFEITATHNETQTEIPSETQTTTHTETQKDTHTEAPTGAQAEKQDISSGDETSCGRLLTQQNVIELRVIW